LIDRSQIPDSRQYETFEAWIRATMAELEMGPKAFGASTGINYSTIYKWLEQSPQWILRSTVAKLVGALGISREELERLIQHRSGDRAASQERRIATVSQRYGEDHFSKLAQDRADLVRGKPRSAEQRARIKSARWGKEGWERKHKKAAFSDALKDKLGSRVKRAKGEVWKAKTVVAAYARRTFLNEIQLTLYYNEGCSMREMGRRLEVSEYVIRANLIWYGLIPVPPGWASRKQVEEQVRQARKYLRPQISQELAEVRQQRHDESVARMEAAYLALGGTDSAKKLRRKSIELFEVGPGPAQARAWLDAKHGSVKGGH
jgi:hypothetical protein